MTIKLEPVMTAVGVYLHSTAKPVWFVEYVPGTKSFIASIDFLHCAALSVPNAMVTAVDMQAFFGKDYKMPVFKTFNIKSHLTPQQLQLLRLQST